MNVERKNENVAHRGHVLDWRSVHAGVREALGWFPRRFSGRFAGRGGGAGPAYVLIRPLLKLLTLPIGCLTLGLFGFVIDAGLILFCARLFPGFSVDGFGWALAAALFISLISAIVSR